MGDKKHIDRLFQEGFKDFEETPSDAVWENIEAKLNQKKKKRRVIPIWWRYAGVAALLLLLLTIGGVYFNHTDKTTTNQISDTEDATRSNFKKDDPTNLDKAKDAITNTDSNENEGLDDTSPQIKTTPLSNTITSSKETSIAEETSTSKNNNEIKEASTLPINKGQNGINKLLNTESNHAVVGNLEEKNNNDKISNKSKSNIAFTYNSEEKKDIEKLQNTLKNDTAIASDSEKSTQVIQQNKALLIDKESTQEIINNASKNNNAIAKTKENNTETAIKDKVTDHNLTIEEVIDKTKNIIEEEENVNRWSIAPNAAPVYFNTLGEGSSLDPQFNSNSKSGELNMSYGISASYAVNKKLSIRSGINKVNLGYTTNDIVRFQSLGSNSSSRKLQNVNSINADNTSDSSPDNVSLVSGESLNSSEIPKAFSTSNTSINQDLGYIEIPLEIKYALSNKKLGVNLIGGFSSFFLNNNKIFSELEGGARTFIGEANNINKVSYSANFGLGLNYQVSKKIDLNLEPMFKYQINTFKNTSGDFKPFFIGVYTGFAIKF